MKNKIIISLSVINLAGILAVSIYLAQSPKTIKCGYVINQTVFEQFLGKREMEEKLMQLTLLQRQELDSLKKTLTGKYAQQEIQQLYGEKMKQLTDKEEELVARYSSSIWMQINQYIEDYGREQQYDFIHGATGNGSLMYAHEAKNITEEVIQYINARYEGK